MSETYTQYNNGAPWNTSEGDDALTNPYPWNGTSYAGWPNADATNIVSPSYLANRISAAYQYFFLTGTGPGGGAVGAQPDDIAYWIGEISVAPPWNAYWWNKFATAGNGGSGGGAAAGPEAGSVNNNPNGYLLTPQLGLLEDDLAYRLSLLCVNVLQPLIAAYPGIVVISGFRQINDGITQHELGEAVDLQISNQTDSLLYEVADYIQKNLNFDQLVLNWTNIGTGAGWIHVSFSATSLRGQVLTKDYADGFTPGLFLVSPLTGDAQAAALNAQAAANTAIIAELQNIQTRQARLGTQSSLIAAVSANAVANTNTVSVSANTSGMISGANLNVIILSSPDVRTWAITAHIRIFGMSPGNMHIEFDRQANWSAVNIGGGTFQQATLWVFLYINGQWYGTAAERLRPLQLDKAERPLFSQWIAGWLNKPKIWGPMAGYVPAIGEQVGIMVTQGSEYLDSKWSVRERSDIFFINWPADGTTVLFP